MEFKEQIGNIKGKVTLDFFNTLTGEHDVISVDNVFVTLGKNSIASRISGTDTTNKGVITYCAVGTGITAPAPADTNMQTEIARKAISVRSSSGKVASFTTYFATSEANGTLKEAGLFGDDATSTVSTGTMFCHTAINRTKTSSDTLTLTWTVTIG